MPMTINGSGSITGLSAGGLPDASITTAEIADLNVTPAKLSQKLTSGTAVASTSGTSIDFTSIPSWVKRITVMFNGVLFSATNQPYLQLGDAGGIELTGYSSFCSSISTSINTTSGTSSVTTGFPLYTSVAVGAAEPLTGSVIITKLDGNAWTVMGNVLAGSRGVQLAGAKTLSDTLTQIRVTTSAGTATFTAGSINIMYE